MKALISAQYIRRKIKDVRGSDLLTVFPMIIAWILSPFFRKKNNQLWLICESALEARDNAYHFFKYMCEKQPQRKCVYAISKKAKDFEKVKQLGKTVEYGSISHWILYFTTQYNISSQKGGKPNAAVCAFFELANIFKPHNVFLQHGITINKVDWLAADKCRFDYFFTASVSETDFLKKYFGYNEGVIHYTGFSRFDNLYDFITIPNRIIIMPTWRKWFALKSENQLEKEIGKSEYVCKWKELLESRELNELIEQYNLEIIFYPHRVIQKRQNIFDLKNKRIIVARQQEYEVQELLKSSSLMITDYSSVFFDMIYMNKPIIFYQFDAERFHENHYKNGWFDYNNNPFSNACKNYQDVILQLHKYIVKDFTVSKKYAEGRMKEFPKQDSLNSQRIYNVLIEGVTQKDGA